MSPDATELWTVAAEDGSISVINIAAGKVSIRIDAKITGANRLKFTPDGKTVLISSLGNGDLFVYDAKTRKERKRINVGHGAAGILTDANGRRAFVACTSDNYIAVVDLQTFTVTGRIDLRGPDGLAWAIQK